MTYKIICDVVNNKVVVNLPSNFKNSKKVSFLVDDFVDLKTTKLEQMKLAAVDSLFIDDIIFI